ncbi:MAG: hypothetical protein JW969_03320 [Spirochaetales bacterium]|nr:hypothetical protein [Spirochaetales bacterium]
MEKFEILSTMELSESELQDVSGGLFIAITFRGKVYIISDFFVISTYDE